MKDGSEWLMRIIQESLEVRGEIQELKHGYTRPFWAMDNTSPFEQFPPTRYTACRYICITPQIVNGYKA